MAIARDRNAGGRKRGYRVACLVVGIVCSFYGPIVAFAAREDLREWETFSETPEPVQLADLVTRGLGPNRHVVLSGYRFGSRYLYSKSKSETRVFYPVFSAGDSPQDGRRAIILIRPAGPLNQDEANRFRRNTRPIQGLLVPKPGFMANVNGRFLNRDEEAQLLGQFPDTDMDSVIVLQEQGRPLSELPFQVLYWFGTVSCVAGPTGILVFWLTRRETIVPTVRPVDSADDSPRV